MEPQTTQTIPDVIWRPRLRVVLLAVAFNIALIEVVLALVQFVREAT